MQDDRTLSYGEWNAYADQLAETLADRGVGAGDVVALRASTRLEWAVTASAVAKLDATLACVPLQAKGRALRRILIETEACAFICDDHAPDTLAAALQGLRLKLRASIDQPAAGFFDFWDLFPAVAPPRFARSQPPAISFREAGRGAMRSVLIPRRRVAPASKSQTPAPEDGVTLITLPLSHSWAAFQLWTALEAGKRIALAPSGEPFDMLAAIERCRVTDWRSFAADFQRLLSLDPASLASFDLSSLRSVIIGGGEATPALSREMLAVFGPILAATYGMPETGLIARLTGEAWLEKPGSCGRVSTGVVVEIRDDERQPLPANAVGEIWARTPASIERALGGDGDLAAVRDEDDFIRTGDFGRLDEEGFLYLVRRSPHPPSRLADARAQV